MVITNLRRRAARLEKRLRESAQLPWSTDLAREVLEFLAVFNRARGEGYDYSHERFWFPALQKPELRNVLPKEHREGESALEYIGRTIGEYVATQGKNGGYELTLHVCVALKTTHHPNL